MTTTYTPVVGDKKTEYGGNMQDCHITITTDVAADIITISEYDEVFVTGAVFADAGLNANILQFAVAEVEGTNQIGFALYNAAGGSATDAVPIRISFKGKINS